MRYEQRAERRGDHGRDEGEQPYRGGLGRVQAVAHDHQVRDRHRRRQTDQGARGEEHGVQGDRRPCADPVPPDHQGAAAHGQQGHGEAAVEGGHRRVQEVGAGLVPVVRPVGGPGGEEGDEQGQGECPDRGADRAQARDVHGEARRRRGHDRRAHHRGVPVGAEMAERGWLCRRLCLCLCPCGAAGVGMAGVVRGGGERVGCGHEFTVPRWGSARQGVPVYEDIRWAYESG